jgi:ligand-binding sensor domain-containing protein/signal transduction histidine kinase
MRSIRAGRWLIAATCLVCGARGEMLRAAEAGARAEARFTIDVWDRDSAMPLFDGGAVVALMQSRDGYLWLGTLNGLVRFDGVQFTIFDENNTPELPSSRIVHLFEDVKENLWIGTETGGAALVKDGKVQALDIGRGSRQGRLVASCEDPEGRVWLYTAGGELCRYDGRQVDVWTLGGAPSSAYRTVISDDSGMLWVGTDWRMSVLDPGRAVAGQELAAVRTMGVGKLDLLLASRAGGHWRLSGGRIQKWREDQVERDYGPYDWGNAPVSSACEDEAGNLVVGTLGAGLYWYQTSGEAVRLSLDEGLSSNYLLSLCFDREGSLWVGTDGGGLNRVRRKLFGVVEASRGLVVQAVAAAHVGGVWVGYNGGGIDHWKDNKVIRYGAGEGLGSLAIRALLADQSGRVWVGTWGAGLLRFQDGRFERVAGAEQLPPVVQALLEDRSGRIWVGTEAGLARLESDVWRLFTVSDGLSAPAVRALAEGTNGDLWIGTWGGGLNRLRDGVFSVYRKQSGFPGDEVTALHMDEEGVLWAGTSGQGLVRFHEESWTRYTTREGLASNSIGYLIEDAAGDFWIGSNAGLMRVSKRELNAAAKALAKGQPSTVAIRTFSRADGLPTSQCTLGAQPVAALKTEGRIWLPTIVGLAHVDPAALQPNPHQPPVAIEAVFVDGQLLDRSRLRPDWTAPIILQAGQERLEIHYTSLNLAAPEQARFRYRMHESAWIPAGNDRVARYSKLPPGEYQFSVTASNEDGVWNETGRGLSIMVEPPFWRTWWFMGGSTIVLLCGVVGGVYYLSTQRLQRQVERLRQQQALDNERARIARDLHDQLGASLTQVSLLGELVESDKELPDEVEAHARQITHTARETTRTLDEIVWAVNPSNDTLDGLITYFCKYAQEYFAVAGIRYRLDVPPQLPATPLPPDVRHNLFLSAKEAVTNVVRHSGATAVHIRLRLDPERLVLDIEDDGCGLAGMDPKRVQTRNGLRNMRKRMEEIGGICTMSPAPVRGTVVSLTAPLERATARGPL